MAVPLSDIQLNNTSLTGSPTAVFVGATAGIGLSTCIALTKHTTSPTIYLVGRSPQNLEVLITSTLQPLNAHATFHAISTEDLTLVRNALTTATAVADTITAHASETPERGPARVDLLFLTTGYIDLSLTLTAENIDALLALRYYSRMAFLYTLTPLLRASPSPRVVSVLGGGAEGAIFADDLLLRKNWSVGNSAVAAGTYGTLFLERWASKEGNERAVCVHIHPGWVYGTGLRMGEGVAWWGKMMLDWVIAPLMRVFGTGVDEAGERVLFAASSGRFRRVSGEGRGRLEGSLVQKGMDGETGSGVYLVQFDSSVKTQNEVLRTLRKEGMGEVVWRHTLDLFEQVKSSDR
jgi:NAD(P)-dependent dehydrogenase (short-subunit alcohol dehydrogenase family)